MQTSPLTTINYTERTLEETPDRAFYFLSGVSNVAAIRGVLAQAGMKDKDIEEGRSLLWSLISGPNTPDPCVDSPDAFEARAALNELDQWDVPNLARAKAALVHYYPSAADYVFHDLKPSKGPGAVQHSGPPSLHASTPSSMHPIRHA